MNYQLYSEQVTLLGSGYLRISGRFHRDINAKTLILNRKHISENYYLERPCGLLNRGDTKNEYLKFVGGQPAYHKHFLSD